MSYIVAATDFSPLGRQALHYAAEVAGRLNMPLRIVTAYMPPVMIEDPLMQYMVPTDIINAAERSMEAEYERLRADFPGLEIQSFSEMGPLEDSLQTAGADSAVLIVTGNAVVDEAGGWLGSSTLDLMRHARTPVLAVGEGSAGLPERPMIALCCDDRDLNGNIDATHLRSLVQLLNARLVVLHVAEQETDTQEAALHAFQSSNLYVQLTVSAPEYVFLTAGDTDSALLSFAESNHADWLAVVPHKHSFFHKLLGGGHTRHILHKSNRPVLALHEAVV